MLGRRAVAGAAVVTSLAFGIRRARAQAAEFVFKFGNNVPATYPLNVRVSQAAERIKGATGGRFDLQIFPAGQLGTDTDMLSQVRSGARKSAACDGSAAPAARWRGAAVRRSPCRLPDRSARRRRDRRAC